MFNTTLISPLMTYQRIFKKSNATRATICGAPEQLCALTSTSTTGTSTLPEHTSLPILYLHDFLQK